MPLRGMYNPQEEENKRRAGIVTSPAPPVQPPVNESWGEKAGRVFKQMVEGARSAFNTSPLEVAAAPTPTPPAARAGIDTSPNAYQEKSDQMLNAGKEAFTSFARATPQAAPAPAPAPRPTVEKPPVAPVAPPRTWFTKEKSLQRTEAPAAGYGNRIDGTPKGTGHLGELPMRDGSGRVATEISMGVNIDGKEMLIPTLVPTLDQKELDSLLRGEFPSPAIAKKAIDHARQRLAKGLSPFAGANEGPGKPAQTAEGQQFVKDYDEKYQHLKGTIQDSSGATGMYNIGAAGGTTLMPMSDEANAQFQMDTAKRAALTQPMPPTGLNKELGFDADSLLRSAVNQKLGISPVEILQGNQRSLKAFGPSGIGIDVTPTEMGIENARRAISGATKRVPKFSTVRDRAGNLHQVQVGWDEVPDTEARAQLGAQFESGLIKNETDKEKNAIDRMYRQDEGAYRRAEAKKAEQEAKSLEWENANPGKGGTKGWAPYNYQDKADITMNKIAFQEEIKSLNNIIENTLTDDAVKARAEKRKAELIKQYTGQGGGGTMTYERYKQKAIAHGITDENKIKEAYQKDFGG